MPSHEAANDQIRQLYVDDHFCYVYKIGIVTNGLGIIRHLDFYNKDFLNAHSGLVPNKKSDSSDEDKSIHDARLLIPTLQDFFKAHPLISPKILLGNATFDSMDIYKKLFSEDTFREHHFSKAFITLNSRSSLKSDYIINENGIPCCPNDSSLAMKSERILTTKSGIKKYKFVCPKMIGDYDPKTQRAHQKCICDNPCTDSKCGRMTYIYPEQNLRVCSGTLHGTKAWDNTYKIKTTVERSINHFKDSFCLTRRRTQYEGREFDWNLILQSSTCEYFKTNQNIIINGFTISGKSFVAYALGKAVCRHLHFQMPEMMEMLNFTEQTGGSISRAVTRLSNYHLLMADEWLLDIPSETQQKYLLETFEKRYDQWPTIFCTQYKIEEWHLRLDGSVLADVIMDRIIHNAIW